MNLTVNILASWWFLLASSVYGGWHTTVVGPYPDKPACESVTKAIDDQTATAKWYSVPPRVYLRCWDGGDR